MPYKKVGEISVYRHEKTKSKAPWVVLAIIGFAIAYAKDESDNKKKRAAQDRTQSPVVSPGPTPGRPSNPHLSDEPTDSQR